MAMTTTDRTPECVLLADRHHGLTEGVRGLLGTLFKMVVMVADESSLQESAARLRPEVVVADLSLARDRGLHWLTRLRRCHPEMKLVVLSVHDEPSVRRAAMDAGADGFVLTRAIATDLLPVIEGVLARPRAGAPASDAHPRRSHDD